MIRDDRIGVKAWPHVGGTGMSKTSCSCGSFPTAGWVGNAPMCLVCLVAERDRLRELLNEAWQRYCEHRPDCLSAEQPPQHCDCGLVQAKDAARKELGATP